MIKRTLYFGNPAYLSLRDEQLVINLAADKSLPATDQSVVTAPIEDIGLVILDHRQITITQAVIEKLLANNVALITCDATHHPVGMMLNLDGHSLQSKRFTHQVEASQPLKKQLWQQTVSAKITNQAAVLKQYGQNSRLLDKYAAEVKSGDSENHEAKAAAYYWKQLFSDVPDFYRERFGPAPNGWLNYGYAILRATVARALVGSGLLPTLGIFHRNQYNAYCLADDIMEPYRPYVDAVVKKLYILNGAHDGIPGFIKKELLQVPAMDVLMDGRKSPLMNAVARTTASLAQCFEGDKRKILYPAMNSDA